MRLLVVEDDPIVLLQTQRFLVEAGYDVVTADDGPAAIQMVHNLPVALDGLIIDFMLPSMNGPEIVERVRAVDPNILIILASAFPDAVPDFWLLQYKVDFLIKPYTESRLIDAVKRLVSKYGNSETPNNRRHQSMKSQYGLPEMVRITVAETIAATTCTNVAPAKVSTNA